MEGGDAVDPSQIALTAVGDSTVEGQGATAVAQTSEGAVTATSSATQGQEPGKQSVSELGVVIISDPGFKDLLQSIGKKFDFLFNIVIDYADKYKGFAEMY